MINHSTTNIDIPVVVIEPEPAKTNHDKLSFLFQFLGHIFNLAVVRLSDGLVAPLCRFWTNYYPRVAFVEEEGVIMFPHSAFTFIINALLAFADIKSQGLHGFPFQTHPHTIMVSVSSLLFYGLTSAAQLFISASVLDPTSVYAIIVRLGRIASLCLLVASLASLFYF